MQSSSSFSSPEPRIEELLRPHEYIRDNKLAYSRIGRRYYNESFLKQQDGLLLSTITNHGDLYAKRNTLNWDILFNLLAEPNKVWAKNAAVLVVVIARKNFEHNEKYSITHQFDAGAAWENLALEASSRGLAVHGIQGFDYERARTDLEVPDNFDIMAMITTEKRDQRITFHHNFRKENIQPIENL
jgi:hypothetical protein